MSEEGNIPVSRAEVVNRLYEKLLGDIEYFAEEYDLGYSDAVATLEVVKYKLLRDLELLCGGEESEEDY